MFIQEFNLYVALLISRGKKQPQNIAFCLLGVFLHTTLELLKPASSYKTFSFSDSENDEKTFEIS